MNFKIIKKILVYCYFLQMYSCKINNIKFFLYLTFYRHAIFMLGHPNNIGI